MNAHNVQKLLDHWGTNADHQSKGAHFLQVCTHIANSYSLAQIAQMFNFLEGCPLHKCHNGRPLTEMLILQKAKLCQRKYKIMISEPWYFQRLCPPVLGSWKFMWSNNFGNLFANMAEYTAETTWLREAFKKKYGIIWEFFPNVGPPPPPPLLGTLRSKWNFWGDFVKNLVCFLGDFRVI